MEEVYYIISAFNDDAEKHPQLKGYPTFVASYNMDLNEGLCLQSGIYDAIKFNNQTDATPFLDKAKKIFSDWEIELVPISKLVFGKTENLHRFVYKTKQTI